MALTDPISSPIVECETSGCSPEGVSPGHIKERLVAGSIWPLVGLIVVAIDTLGLYCYLSHRVYLLNPVWIYLTVYGILFGFYAYAAGRLVPGVDPRHERLALWLIVGAAVVFRAFALPSSPSLSTDMYRYVWDGRLTMHGINPYRWSPVSPCLRSLRDPVWDLMEYKYYQTIYMPMSQVVFALCNAIFHNNLLGYKAVFTAFDVGVIALLYRLLRKLGRSGLSIIWYAWCPLPITEIAIAGHQDVVGVFFLMLTILLAGRERTAWATGITLVAATLTKGIGLFLFPLFLRAFGRRFAVVAAVSLLYLGMPMWVYFPEFLHGMSQYLDTVHVNASLFQWTNYCLSLVTSAHYEITARLSDAVMAGVALWAAWRPVDDYADLIRRSFIVMAVVLLVVPTLFPWYLTWVIPFLPLISRRPSWAFVALVCTIGLLYTYYIAITPLWWTSILEYVPFYVILGWEYANWRRGTGSLTSLRGVVEAIPSWVRRAGTWADVFLRKGPHGA